MQTDFNQNRIAALLAEIGDGIGCRHRFEPEHGISADLLAGAGLITPINTRIPACVEHHCPLCGQCQFEHDFDKDSKEKRGNRKFRLSDAGRRAIDDPGETLTALTGSAAARAVISILQSGPSSIFAMTSSLMEAELRSARDEAPAPGYGRKELGDCLKLLAGIGVLEIEPDGTVRRLDALS